MSALSSMGAFKSSFVGIAGNFGSAHSSFCTPSILEQTPNINGRA
jgi:hypothetical protein